MNLAEQKQISAKGQKWDQTIHCFPSTPLQYLFTNTI